MTKEKTLKTDYQDMNPQLLKWVWHAYHYANVADLKSSLLYSVYEHTTTNYWVWYAYHYANVADLKSI